MKVKEVIMKIGELRASVRNFRAGIPGLVSLLVFDRERNLLLYGESDDLVFPLGRISSCYARLAGRLERAHACRKASLGKSVKCMNIVSGRMAVSLRVLSEKHLVVGECASQKGLGLLATGASSLANAMEEVENE